MIFNSFNFIVLYPILFLLYYAIPAKHNNFRNFFLLALSYILYLNWKPVYALILLFVTAVTFFGAQLLTRIKIGGGNSRKFSLLTLLVVLSAGPLIIFKYYNFLNDSLSSLLSIAGLKFALPGLNLMVPVGISFFTFQAICYLWDVYYKKVEPEKNLLHHVPFISFFQSSCYSGILKPAAL